MSEVFDVLVLGTGIAGCSAALSAAREGARVLVVTRSERAESSNTFWAQGGIVGRPPGDSPEGLAADIEKAGGGLCNPSAVELLSREGPDLVEKLLIGQLGVPFDREDGSFQWALEGAHSLPRVLHVKDETGIPIERALLAAVQSQGAVEWRTAHTAVDFLTPAHDSSNPLDRYAKQRVFGAYLLERSSGRVSPVSAHTTILATGGLGQVFLHTTNPPGARGDGLAMAARAGARLLNLQFVQFHPTALVHPKGRLLISEALRGAGAKITDAAGRPFLKDFDPREELAPRDVVARAIHRRMLDEDQPHVLLDISHKPREWILERFPGVAQRCREAGYDVTKGPVPIVPAAHYSCGGVAVDLDGRTTLSGLFAAGEVSCTGVHGANRLASTSLLEGLLWGWRAGRLAAAQAKEERAAKSYTAWDWQPESEPVDAALVSQDWLVIKHTMWNYVGLVRSGRRLDRARRILQELRDEIEDFYRHGAMSDALIGLRNGVRTAQEVTRGAAEDRVSRGTHFREDSQASPAL
ncbi:MAG: L-aspartate oxidase [Thermoanaerobaculia bacterium]